MDMIFGDHNVSKRLDEEMQTLQMVESQFVREAPSFKDRLQNLIRSGGAQAGSSMPWSNVDETQRLRPGELSIWAGINGHGKSLILGQVLMWQAKHQKILIASLEMTPEETLMRMVNQYAGCEASENFAGQVVDQLKDRIWIYDQLDTVPPERILALVHYAAKDLKVNHIAIDSLMKCGMDYEDYKAEKRFIDRLQNAAKRLGVHIHLVAHMKKGKSEYEMPDKFSVSGGAYLTNIPDNVFIVHRNKYREDALEKQAKGALEKDLSTLELKALQQPDVWLKIPKNRHGRKEGLHGLYFHKNSGQYMPKHSAYAMPAPF